MPLQREMLSAFHNLHWCMHAQSFRLFATPQTVACQAPLSMEFLRQEYCAGCHGPLQGIFLTQGSNPCLLCLLHWQACSLLLEPPGKETIPNFILLVVSFSPQLLIASRKQSEQLYTFSFSFHTIMVCKLCSSNNRKWSSRSLKTNTQRHWKNSCHGPGTFLST